MAGKLTQAELLKIFPVEHAPIMHGRSRVKKRKTKGATAHGRGRHGSHLPTLAKKDPFKHKAQAHGQG